MILLNKSKFQISIITAVYNRKDILKRAIESLQEQIFSDFALIESSSFMPTALNKFNCICCTPY